MLNSFSLEDRVSALRWLRHGAELAQDLKAQPTHRDVIWSLLVESVGVIDRLPDQERRWLTSGTRSGGWNNVGLTRADLKEIERVRLISAMKPHDGASKTVLQSADIDRALGVMGWLNWCNDTRMADRLKKAAIALARGGETDLVHRIYCPTRKPNRQNISEIKTRTIGFILTGLKQDLKIIPVEGFQFKEA